MQALHEHGTFTLPTPTPLPDAVTPSQASLVLESPTFDEMSRLWQALGVPLRTTAQYRVSVVFLTPDQLPPPAPEVHEYRPSPHPGRPRTTPHCRNCSPRAARWSSWHPALGRRRSAIRAVARNDRTRTGRGDRPGGAGRRPDARRHRRDPAGVVPRRRRDRDRRDTTWKVPLTTPYPTAPAHGVPFIVRVPPDTPWSAGRYELRVARPGAAAGSGATRYPSASRLGWTRPVAAVADGRGRCVHPLRARRACRRCRAALGARDAHPDRGRRGAGRRGSGSTARTR